MINNFFEIFIIGLGMLLFVIICAFALFGLEIALRFRYQNNRFETKKYIYTRELKEKKE